MFITAQKIYEMLQEQKIEESRGKTVMTFMDISTVVHERSAMGNLIEEWLRAWMRKEHISFRLKANSQEFPDFFLDADSDKIGLLEIKTFDWERSPNFDVANFDAYCRSLLSHAYRLDADYLILAYTLESGELRIPKIWLKKIWEITGSSGRFAIKCQVKQNMIYNIRPITWYAKNATFPHFQSRLEFVQALAQTIISYKPTETEAWLEQVRKNYAEHTGQNL